MKGIFRIVRRIFALYYRRKDAKSTIALRERDIHEVYMREMRKGPRYILEDGLQIEIMECRFPDVSEGETVLLTVDVKFNPSSAMRVSNLELEIERFARYPAEHNFNWILQQEKTYSLKFYVPQRLSDERQLVRMWAVADDLPRLSEWFIVESHQQ